jgi:tetratricopeptide (TPR) repeat protein
MRYCAFLSYSHADDAHAEWLHRCLEQFRVPRALVGRVTARGAVPPALGTVFRDRQELAASSDLGSAIRDAIAQSRALIVLCSPAAARSRWTNEEILAFKQQHPDGLVLAAIVAGEPFASALPGREAEECFPPALRQRFDSRGVPTAERGEPIAADLREGRDGRRVGLLKIVAGLLGVGLDDLVQREQQRRHKRLAILAAASLAGMAVTSTLAVSAFAARNEAREQRREAEGLVGFMLGDLRKKLEPIGRLDTLDAVGARALQYFEGQDKSELSDAALAQRSRALTLMGEIASARGDLNGALRRYREAWAGTAEALRRRPDDPQAIFDHAQNVFWVGSIDYQRGRYAEAEAAWREYKRLAEQLVALDPRRSEWRLERIYADTNLGIVLLKLNRFAEASRTFARGLQDSEALAAAEPANGAYRDQLTEALAWLAQSRESEGAIDEALGHRQRQFALLGKAAATDGRDTSLKSRMMVAHRALGRLFAMRGDSETALRHSREAVRTAEELMETERDRSDWAETGSASYIDLGELQLALADVEQAAVSARAGCSIADRLIRRDPTVVDWRSTLRGECLALRSKVALASGMLDAARSLADRAVEVAQREAMRGPSSDARLALANARALRGTIAQRSRDPAEAQRQFQAASEVWPTGVEMTPRALAQRLLILEALGRRDEAARITARLRDIGYRHPSFARERAQRA